MQQQDTAQPAEVATDAAPALRYEQMLAVGDIYAQNLLRQLSSALRDLAALPYNDPDGTCAAEAFVSDSVYSRALDELPDLARSGRSLPVCSAMAHALFGPELVPDPISEERGATAQTAFLIARVFMAASRHTRSRLDVFLLAAATVVQWALEAQSPQSAE